MIICILKTFIKNHNKPVTKKNNNHKLETYLSNIESNQASI